MVKTKLPYALTFLSGLLLGWLALGWWLWPVAYVGEAYTYELNQADKLRYASAVVDSFAATGIADPSWFGAWTPEEIRQELEQVAQHNPAKANWARALANQVSVSTFQPVQIKAQNQAKDTLDQELVGAIGFRAIVIILAVLVCGGAWLIWRRRDNALARERMHEQIRRDGLQRFAVRNSADYIPVSRIIPKQAFTTAQLTFGPDQPTDQHFPIESHVEGEPSLGEFGINQVEDQPAWDVWLFDQKALVTVTKVLADQASEELASRGKVIGWNDPITLETPNLKMVGEVSKLGERFTVELTVEAKDEN